MALAVSNAARLKPDIRLAKAVSEFEADLTDGQKADFRVQRSLAQQRPPEPSDVMLLTAKIDNAMSQSQQGLRMRCVGPRLTNVLSSIQQYVGMGDIIIGGSQNLIACGVWALVRTSLMLVVNHNAYLEKLSMLFMNAGRSAPRYQQLALIYQKSKPLQAHFCEYLIVVVRICHQTLRFSKKSYLGQLGASLSDADIKDYQRDLELWATSIKEEVTLLTSQRIEDEAIQNSRFRAISSMLSSTAAHRATIKERLRVLDTCSTYDYQTTWKQARKIGNTSLHVNNQEYQEWRRGHTTRTFICTGKLGSGKSVLLANIVDDLNLYAEADKIPVAYFFCRHDIPDSLRPRVIIGSLLRQLLSAVGSLSSLPESISGRPLGAETELVQILNYFFNNFKPSSRSYFVLDGLDECAQDDREVLLDHCRNFQERLGLALCVSYRLEADNRLQLRLSQFASPVVFSIPETNPEIEAFIDAELQARVGSDKLSLGDPNLILDIREALLHGAQGMFLWVTLQISSLCSASTDEEIRLTLRNLPRTLSDTFTQILEKAKGRSPNHQRPILESVTVARQPLTAEQLREVLAVVPGYTEWNPSRLVNDIQATLACCGGLIIMDEEEDTIRLVHHSVKSYLLHETSRKRASDFDLDNASHKMGKVILTYLNYNVFDRQVSTKVVPTISGGTAAQRVINSITTSRTSTKMVALHLLQSRLGKVSASKPDYDIGHVIANHSKNFSKGWAEEAFAFRSYAMVYWPHHTAFMSNENAFYQDALHRLLEVKDNQGVPTPWEQPAGNSQSPAVRTQSSVSVPPVVSRTRWTSRIIDDKRFQRSYTPPPVSWALLNSHAPLLRHCIRAPGALKALASTLMELRRFNRSPMSPWPWHETMCTHLLPLAILQGCHRLVRNLLDYGAPIAYKEYCAVKTAIDRDELRLLDLLLQKAANKAEVKACIDSHDIDVVYRACLQHDFLLISRLISLEVDLNRSAATYSLIWVLSTTFSVNRIQTIRELIMAGVTINTPGQPNASFNVLMIITEAQQEQFTMWLIRTLSSEELDKLLLLCFQRFSALSSVQKSAAFVLASMAMNAGAKAPPASGFEEELTLMIQSMHENATYSMVDLFMDNCDIERLPMGTLEALLLEKQESIIKLLFIRGLDRKVIRSIISECDLLQRSIALGSNDHVEFLCDLCSADMNASNPPDTSTSWRTPLLTAIMFKSLPADRFDMVMGIIYRGADVNYRGTMGYRSPLEAVLDRVISPDESAPTAIYPSQDSKLHPESVTFLRISRALIKLGAQVTDYMIEQVLTFSLIFFAVPEVVEELDSREHFLQGMAEQSDQTSKQRRRNLAQGHLDTSPLFHIEKLLQEMVLQQPLSASTMTRLVGSIKDHMSLTYTRHQLTTVQNSKAATSSSPLWIGHIVTILSILAHSRDPYLTSPLQATASQDTASSPTSLKTPRDVVMLLRVSNEGGIAYVTNYLKLLVTHGCTYTLLKYGRCIVPIVMTTLFEWPHSEWKRLVDAGIDTAITEGDVETVQTGETVLSALSLPFESGLQDRARAVRNSINQLPKDGVSYELEGSSVLNIRNGV